MYNVVLSFLKKNQDRLTFAPAITGFIESLERTSNQISEMQEAQLTSSKGHTQSKKELKQKLVADLLEIIKRARAYAVVSNDLLLKEEMNYSATQLLGMPQESLIIACRRVLAACEPRMAELSAYGLKDDQITIVSDTITLFTAALPGAKTAIAQRKTATSELVNLFAEADEWLRKIDAMMEIVSTNDGVFYQDYRNLRVIDDLRGKSKPNVEGETGIMGTVGNIETGDDMPGVKLSLEGTSYATTSDAAGNFSFALPAGTYTLKASLSGFADYTEEDIEVIEGEYAEVDIDMEAMK
jgi:hypothetical protein